MATIRLALDLGFFLVGVTAHAQRQGRSGDQLGSRYIFVDPDLVASQATARHRRVDRGPLGQPFMTAYALGTVRRRLQWDGVLTSLNWQGRHPNSKASDK